MLYNIFSQLSKRCMQTSYHKINNLKIDIRCLSEIPINKEESPRQNVVLENRSISKTRHIGYRTIYRLPRIKYVALFNKMKCRLLVASTIIIPIMGILDGLEIVSHHVGLVSSIIACSSTLSLFTVGLLFDNQIGFIYYKDDGRIKIAYVDIWGRRLEIDTSVKDIKSLTLDKYTMKDKLYRTIHLHSLKIPLKLVVNETAIYDKEMLANVVGDY